MSTIDWPLIANAYITTGESLGALARRFAVSDSAVRKHSREEGWPARREAYLAEGRERALDQAAAAHADRLADLQEAARLAAAAIASALEDPKQFHRYLVTVQDKSSGRSTQEQCFRKLDTKALKEVIDAIRDLTDLTREFYNLPTTLQQLNEEQLRLKNEELRHGPPLPEDETDARTGVILLPPVRQ